jgi:hypothetical protein
MDLPYSVYSLPLDNRFTGPDDYSRVYTSWISWLERQILEVERQVQVNASDSVIITGYSDFPVEPPDNLWTATHHTGRRPSRSVFDANGSDVAQAQ